MTQFEPSTLSHVQAHPPEALVPAGFAEKAMASLMQLHTELVDEKERRVELYRRLMEREQTVADLRMYVKLLEERMARAAGPSPAPPAPSQKAPPRPAQAPAQATAPARAGPETGPGRDGWKVW
jgi:hypothetical protein